jgi:hypothetical protein
MYFTCHIIRTYIHADLFHIYPTLHIFRRFNGLRQRMCVSKIMFLFLFFVFVFVCLFVFSNISYMY